MRDLPKTRNAKVMRRVIRAAYLGDAPGDLLAREPASSSYDIGAVFLTCCCGIEPRVEALFRLRERRTPRRRHGPDELEHVRRDIRLSRQRPDLEDIVEAHPVGHRSTHWIASS